MNIISGVVPSAQKVVVYGPEGIGKSTFASQFPSPLFSDTEGSTKKLDVQRFEAPSSWQMLIMQAEYVRDNIPCLTYIVDSADWAEKLCIRFICDRAKKTSIEDFGYGKGYMILKEEFAKFLNLLDEIIAKNVNVVFTAHSYLKKFEKPDEQGAYDRYEMKLTKYVAPLVKEWADMVLFVNYKTTIVYDENNKAKAQGGKRVMYTTHHACWDAKNRDDLADELPFEFEQIKSTFNLGLVEKPTLQGLKPDTGEKFKEIIDEDEPTVTIGELPPEEPKETKLLHSDNPTIQKLYDLMNANGVSVEVLKSVVADSGYYPQSTPIENYDADFISGCLIAAWDQVYVKIKAYTDVPFN